MTSVDMPVDMKDIVALCKRRGFIFQASEIYGGYNGFWDFGPLGTELKNNLRDSWWHHMVVCPPIGPDGTPVSVVGLDSAIIQNPKVWHASGHVGGFNDPMVDCRESKSRYRADHLIVYTNDGDIWPAFYNVEDDADIAKRLKKLKLNEDADSYTQVTFDKIDADDYAKIIGPDTKKAGTLTEPRQFSMMLDTFPGVIRDEERKAYLRPETAQGIFTNYKNILDSMRVKPPFGIAQVGKAFRNEVTPRNFIFRSREFEQMEMEWFCPPEDHEMWFEFWVDQRKNWWKSVGMDESKLFMHDIEAEELAHYSSRTIDIEYKYPFSDPKFDELEGIAHRGDYDLSKHQEHSGQKLEYFDQQENRRYLPHVIEPAAGLTRGVLALICEAYTIDENRPSGVYLNFTPAMAPKKAAILPLTAKEDHVPIAQKLYLELREEFAIDLDIKQNIGKRYARQDEIGTPYCFTIDNDTLADQTVTVRERNTMEQTRIHLDKVAELLREKIG